MLTSCLNRERRTAIIKREESKQSNGMSSLGLTPGTPTMRIMEADIERWVEETLLNEKEWGHLHIELSRTSVPVRFLPHICRHSLSKASFLAVCTFIFFTII